MSDAAARIYRLGRIGSSDRIILRVDEEGIYLSVRVVGAYGFGCAFGPRYISGVFLRRPFRG